MHTFEGGATLFENSIDRLSASGVYVIEDVRPKDLAAFTDYFAGKLVDQPYDEKELAMALAGLPSVKAA